MTLRSQLSQHHICDRIKASQVKLVVMRPHSDNFYGFIFSQNLINQTMLKSFHEQNLAKLSSWKFIEMWVDPTHDLPYVLMLVGDVDGSYSLYDPTESYKVVYSSQDYKAVKDFLLEDEYEQIRGRYQEIAHEAIAA